MTVRTRFAPSPTGFLHIGGLRTALYNFLYAKKKSGKFILRIEDTDQNRLVNNALENLASTLKICGLKYDEGPDVSGNFGPYIQSQRLEIYKKNLMQLIEKGSAYPCFFTANNPDELLPELNIKNAIERMGNENYVVKFKIQSNKLINTFDEIRGKITFDLSLVEDPIIFKADGYPTYHFANVIDDYYMKISHVIRGEEWLPSLPKHILIYKSFNWELPKFCHLPLLLNTDKTKLSKRQGDVAVEDFLDKGYLKESIINFVALLGWHPKDNQEIFKLDNLIKKFSLDRVNKSGAVFDIEKLNWMNKKYLSDIPTSKLIKQIVIKLQNQGFNNITNKKLYKMIEFAKPRACTISDIVNEIIKFIRYTPPNKLILNKYDYKNLGQLWCNKLRNKDTFDNMIIKKLIHLSKQNLGIAGKNLFIPLRLMLIGQEHGPDLYTIINILGLKESIKRIKINIAN